MMVCSPSSIIFLHIFQITACITLIIGKFQINFCIILFSSKRESTTTVCLWRLIIYLELPLSLGRYTCLRFIYYIRITKVFVPFIFISFGEPLSSKHGTREAINVPQKYLIKLFLWTMCFEWNNFRSLLSQSHKFKVLWLSYLSIKNKLLEVEEKGEILPHMTTGKKVKLTAILHTYYI